MRGIGQVCAYLGDTKDWLNLQGVIEGQIEQVSSDVVGEGFVESAEFSKLYSGGSGNLLHNVRQGNDTLHFHMGLHLRGITGSTVEDGLEEKGQLKSSSDENDEIMNLANRGFALQRRKRYL